MMDDMTRRPIRFVQLTSHFGRPGLVRCIQVICLLVAAALLLLSGPSLLAQTPGISSPATGSSVGGDVPVMGTAVIETFQKYELHYKQEPSGDDAYIYFDGGTTPVENGQLAIWRASGLPPGAYSLRLRVVKADGNYAEYFSQNISVNQGPTPTPTSDEPTETPIPTATFTPAPQPTAEVGQVEQPGTLADEAAEEQAAAEAEQPTILLPTPTPAAAAGVIVNPGNQGATAEEATAGSVTRELGEALAIERLRQFFMQGMRISATIFALIGLVFGGRWLFSYLRNR